MQEKTLFPFASEIPITADLCVHYSLVLKEIGPLLTESRKKIIDRVLPERNFSNPIVLEGIYDRGNVSAVMRSGEAFGFVNFHVIEIQEKFKEANRVTKGADKWVETTKWKTTQDCVKRLKESGYKIVATSLEGARPIGEIDFSIPTALVLGNEKDGVSAEMLAAADEKVIIPMTGFVQSFNISVAGALAMYHIMQDRIRRLGHNGDLSAEECDILKAIYYLRTQDSAADFLKEKFKRQQLV